MRSIYLGIWRLQMSLGAALSNKASVKLQTVKAHTYSLLWPWRTGKVLINTENVSQAPHRQFGSLPVLNHSQWFVMAPSLLWSFCQTYRTKCTLRSVQHIQTIVQIKVLPDIQTSPPTSLLSLILLHFRASVLRSTVRPLHDACLCTSDVWICSGVGIPPTCLPVVNTPELRMKICLLLLCLLHSSQHGG